MTTPHRPAPEPPEDESRPGEPAQAEEAGHTGHTRSTSSWWRSWRVGPPVVLALCGTLFIVSATNSDGADLRPGRYTSLSSLVEQEADAYARLQDRAAGLDTEVGVLGQQVQDRAVRKERRRAARLQDAAGLGDTEGPGVTVVLSDSPTDVLDEALDDPELNINLLVVHQQDIQAVVNAMWGGGAEAVTIQGQRVITTTGIKCEGNAVQLQGVPYPQPYVISAIGDPSALVDALGADSDVERFRADAESPEISVGWELDVEDQVVAPAYDDLLDVTVASPQRG